MRVDGREVAVSGSLVQPRIRRSNDMLRLVVATLILATVVTGSAVIPDGSMAGLERSISDIVGVQTPDWSVRLYLVYGGAVLALPLAILVNLLVACRWKILAACASAGLIAVLALSFGGTGYSGPRRRLDGFGTVVPQFLDDPRWIAMVTAVLTVSGPWLSGRWGRFGWALLLAFGPVHLAVSAVVPAESLLGLAVGWLVGALAVLVVGTPALVVPLEEAVQAMAKRGFLVTGLTVLRHAGPGPLVLATKSDGPIPLAIVEMYGPNQSSGGALRHVWRSLRFRADETSPLQASLHRVVEHRALMTIAVAAAGVANIHTMAFAPLQRGWMMYAHTSAAGTPITEASGTSAVTAVWEALDVLHRREISHGDLRASEITLEGGSARFGGLHHAELGSTDAQFQSDIAQLLLTTSKLGDAQSTVGAALAAFGKDAVLAASGRLTQFALPRRIRQAVVDFDATTSAVRNEVMRQTGVPRIPPLTITRFSRSQVIQLVLLIAFVYVAYPFISALPTFFSELKTVNWWWASFGLAASLLTYVGAAAALWACASKAVRFWRLAVLQAADTFAAITTPAGVGGLALSARFLQKNGGLSAVHATAAVALQQAAQVVTHIGLLTFFSVVAGTSADLAHFVPRAAVLFLIAGLLLGVIGVLMAVPRLRRWLGTAVRPRLTAVIGDLLALAREPRRLAIIVLGCAATTLGGALALWASIEAVGGGATFVTVTVVTMIGGTLASAAPTPGGVGAVEAALIGGLAAFGMPAAVAVPSVLLYRILTCWLPVLVGWAVMRWLTANDLI
ncbi:lysylphosphatidylglycerol synthase transmembrane domain-containing protein [Mycolicibacterium sp. ND9-15]|uniref:lysylphosphatidylglycerol synthase transmembrane domain-containing protein n=1 Tax=Mycolicibacterium sp. ND9-15 TaxID=3042320 RepID=UPI002DDA110D|nr:lysylphosphatidylglycerol synthase transmembrane domain-containing protein [Mycolicibacterium sp. ND9-15]WSE58086.1 lysylphosphatidylglycerol synthase transmembrane domain-containing protein [Mycolicibacterium sp. ND9-15]